MTISTHIQEGQLALAEGAWALAKGLFVRALEEADSADAYAGLADAAWWLGDEDEVFVARERAYQLYQSENDQLSAATMATWLFLDSMEFRGETAIANGWMQRAKQLLEGHENTREYGWLMVWEGSLWWSHENDAAKALELAEVVLEIGTNLDDPDLKTLGLALEGLAMVDRGQIVDGFALLDHAAVATMSGEVGAPVARSTTMCWVIGACDHARDYERALQWSERFKQVEHSWRVDGMFSICRPHYAPVLIQHGRWADAEHELEEGIRVLTRFRPPMARESLVRLAELRWRQGKSDAARALFLAAEADGLSLVGRAEMALDEGDPETAVDLLNRNLRHVSANNRLEHVAGLGLLVAAALAEGDQAQAETAMHDLMDIAEVVGTAPLKAASLLAQGRIAKHSKAFEDAREAFEDAADLFGQRGATYDCARARIELAQVLLPLDRAMQATHEAELAIAVLRPMGAKRDLKRAVSVLNEARSAGAPKMRGISDGLTAREGEVLLMLASGRSNQEVAEALTLSLRTVERHVSNTYGKVGGDGKTGRAAATAYAYQQGLL